MEASLTCAVCLGVFREPVTLPLCSHNFCKSCVKECADPQLRICFNSEDGSVSVPARITCPLCRKVSCIPGGVSALSINTTLAELARMLPQSGAAGSRDHRAECPNRDHCPDHPEHMLELFCKNCAQPCCGKCVSVSHQGIFHNVNLLDMVYQEEKLMFFNSLKKLREVYEKFTKEMSDDDKDVNDALKKNTDMVNSAFDEVQKALELKRLQLLDFIKQQQSTAIKHYEVRKKTKAHHKVTLENLLKDCESLVDEFEPKCFLKVSCGLNKRMKSNLDLVELTASHFQDVQKPDLDRVDLQAVLDAISTLQISASASNDSLPKPNKEVLFKNVTRKWKSEAVPTEKYCPVQNQELCYLQGQIQKMAIRLLSITEMPEYKHLSFEELRMKYYENSAIQENIPGQQEQALPIAEDSHHLGTAEITRFKNLKIKRAAGFGGGFSLVKPIHGAKASSKTDLNSGPQKEVQIGAAVDLPSVAAIRMQVPASSLGEASCGLSSDVNSMNHTQDVQETKFVAPSFCFGRVDATSVTKPIKFGKSWKKPKTTTLVPATENAEPLKSPLTSRKIFVFSNTADSNGETNVINPFRNPLILQEPTTQGNEAIEDHATQSNSSEEFYDAVSNENSDVEDTEEPGRSSENKDELSRQQDL